jgi:hypothetical protein
MGIAFGNKEEEPSGLRKSTILHEELWSMVDKMSTWQCTWLIAYCVGRLHVAANKPSDEIYKDLIYQAELIMKGK